MNKKRNDIPFKISLIYAFFSALWIIFSDRILLMFVKDINLMATIQTVKGWFFIVVTTLLVFNLLKREFIKIRKLEELMIQNEKMLSVSSLALGMANEINNPLAGIAQNAQILKNRLLNKLKPNLDIAESIGLDFDKLAEYVEKRELERIIDSLITSSKSASEIIDSVLSFSLRDSKDHKVKKNIGKLLDITLDLLLKDQSYSDVVIVKEYNAVPDILCDPSKLQHVFFNILTNALEAMVESRIEPRIFLRISKSDNFVKVEIEDAGPGMSDKISNRIFEPFFTTKESARGLGLAISYYIISEVHRGYLNAESKIGKRTNMIIRLPLS